MKLLVWFVFLAFFAFAIADDEDAILHSTGIALFAYATTTLTTLNPLP